MTARSTIGALKKLIDPIKRSAMLGISRLIVKAINDTGGLQIVKGKVFADVTKDGIERMQNYGFTSVPVAGAEAVVVFPGGNQDHGIVIAIDDRRYRLKSLQAGEVAMYSDEGDYIHFKRGRIIDVSTQTLNLSASTAINIETPSFNVTASSGANFTTPTLATSAALDAVGNITCLNETVSIENFKDRYNEHVHNENGTGGGITDPTTSTI